MTFPAAPAPAQVEKKPLNAVGLAALVVAIVAFIFAIVPVLSFIAWLPAVVAIGLAIAGFVVKNRGRVFPIIAIILAPIAIIVGIFVSLGTIVVAANDAVQDDEATAAELIPIVIEVTGDGTADIDYTITIDGTDSGEATDDVTLPWTFEDQIPRGGTFDFNYYSVTVTSGAEESTIACKLTVDGKVLAEDSSTGSFGFIICSGSSSDLDEN